MRWSKLVKAWNAAEQAAEKASATRKLVKQQQARERLRQHPGKPRASSDIDAAVERFLNVVVGALVAAMVISAILHH